MSKISGLLILAIPLAVSFLALFMARAAVGSKPAESEENMTEKEKLFLKEEKRHQIVKTWFICIFYIFIMIFIVTKTAPVLSALFNDCFWL